MQQRLEQLNQTVADCTRCPRLVTYLEEVGERKRASYREEDYWSRPVPNLLASDERPARILIVGLAPGAHGANRTGRMFTGDRSGDFLFEAMHHAGLCNQPTSKHRQDGLTLRGCVITAAAHCAPPGNKPTGEELTRCRDHLTATIDLMPELKAVVTLGRIAHDAVLSQAIERGWIERRKDAPFGHGLEHRVADGAVVLLPSYHPSQQNTFTRRLTMPMLTQVFQAAAGCTRDAIGPDFAGDD
ncbi:MAG: uracil-DNA glycosylase [Phycisphaeraceae bacterium]